MDKSALITFIRQVSLKKGDFTLASGQKSSFYIDLKLTTLHPRGIDLIAKYAYQKLIESEWVIEGIGGPTLGADPLATGISLEAYRNGRIWPAFIVRKNTKSHGTDQSVEGRSNLAENAKVVILEDVVTTGGSSLDAIEKVRAERLNPVGVLSVVDRQAGAKQAYEREGLAYVSLCQLSDILD